MTIDDLKNDWRSQRDEDLVRLTPDEILAYVATRSRRLDRQLRWRDWREYLAAAVALVVIAPGALRATALARVGLVALVGAFALMTIALHRARRVRDAVKGDESVAEALRTERVRVEAQVRLLDRVVFWYVIPISLAVVLIVAGTTGMWWATVGIALFMALVGLVIQRLNAWAVRTSLRPRLAELSRLQAEMDEAGAVRP